MLLEIPSTHTGSLFLAIYEARKYFDVVLPPPPPIIFRVDNGKLLISALWRIFSFVLMSKTQLRDTIKAILGSGSIRSFLIPEAFSWFNMTKYKVHDWSWSKKRKYKRAVWELQLFQSFVLEKLETSEDATYKSIDFKSIKTGCKIKNLTFSTPDWEKKLGTKSTRIISEAY